MKTIFSYFLVLLVLFTSSCASIFIPKNQKITFYTQNKNAEIYLDNDSIGSGEKFTVKVNKKDKASKQIVIREKDHKDQYTTIIKTKTPAAYYPLLTIGLLCYVLPGYWDWLSHNGYSKLTAYDREVKIESTSEVNKLVFKKENHKYIYVSNIKFDIKEKELKDIYVDYDKLHMAKAIEKAESKNKKDQETALAKQKKKDSKKKKTKSLVEKEDNGIKFADTKYSDQIYKTLKKTGYVDTLNKVFTDNNNSLVLEARVTGINGYKISSKWATYNKAKVFLTWYVKNTYGEILDSLKTSEYSGDFVSDYSNDYFVKMVGDAIDISYLKLHKQDALIKNIEINKNYTISDDVLKLVLPKDSLAILDNSDASLASVIVKTKEDGKDSGHGSGFAITNDGYILTNYHVISGKVEGKFKDIFIITPSGKEISAKLVRTNKYRDIALLKIDENFEKAFQLSKEKKFKKLQDIYTIGAPKSIELGQSVSSGIISNLRENANTNPVLQLGMSVNGGNSGGPVFDKNGVLHGVIQSKLVGSNTEGVSFAIPAYLIQDYLNINFN